MERHPPETTHYCSKRAAARTCPRLMALCALAVTGCATEVAQREAGSAPAGTPGPGSGCVARAADAVPRLLSQLGCFDGDDPRWLAAPAIAFSVNAPLWSDDADKERFMAVPQGKRIDLDDQGDFVLPVGTVLGKTFIVGGERVETRVLMHDETDGWHGVAYRWNDTGTDAELAPAEGVTVEAAGEQAQPWTIPSRGQCFACHGDESHVALGLEVAQLEGDFTDPYTGEGGNQLDRLVARGLLDDGHPMIADRTARPKLPHYDDAGHSVAARARAYLHANCSSCHNRAEGFCTGDLRRATLDSDMGVCNATPTFLDARYGWPEDTRLVAPGEPERSAIVHRMRAPGGSPLAMPPIGRHRVDGTGVALVTEWIAQMRGCAQ